MARPEEKAQSMLNKWTKMKDQGENYNEIQAALKRPYLASMCEHLHECEKFRRQICKEIATDVSKIQNPGLSEHVLRDINDNINKLIREKWHWNKRIIDLNGPNYHTLEKREQDTMGDSHFSIGLKGSGGYRYFGAAKELPGVKELFARHATKVTKRKRGDIYKYITADYYGLRDDEDGVLEELEEQASKKRQEQIQLLREKYHKDLGRVPEQSEDELDCLDELGEIDEDHIQKIVKQSIVEQSKQDLMKKLLF